MSELATLRSEPESDRLRDHLSRFPQGVTLGDHPGQRGHFDAVTARAKVGSEDRRVPAVKNTDHELARNAHPPSMTCIWMKRSTSETKGTRT